MKKLIALVLLCAPVAFAQVVVTSGAGGGVALGATGAGSYVPLNGATPMTGPLDTPRVNADFNIAASLRNGGDSTGAGVGSPSGYGYAQRLDADFGAGIAVNNTSVGGSWMCDANYYQSFAIDNPGATSAPLFTLLLGANDQSHMHIGPYEVNTINCATAIGAWWTQPSSNKVFAQAATPTGTWTADTTYQTGIGQNSTTNGSTLHFSFVASGQGSGLYYRVIDGNGGTFDVSVDGVFFASVNAFPVTPINTVASGNGSGGTTQAVWYLPFATLAAGTHTADVTVTSATGAGNIVGITSVGTFPVLTSTTFQPPKLFLLGLPYRANDSDSAETAAYNADLLGVANQLIAWGSRTTWFDTRACVSSDPANYDVADWGATTIHMNDVGYGKFHDCLAAAIHPFPGATLVGGSSAVNRLTVSVSTALSGPEQLVQALPTTSTITITLPLNNGLTMTDGKTIEIDNDGTAPVHMAHGAGQGFAGVFTGDICPGQRVQFVLAYHPGATSFWFSKMANNVGTGDTTLYACGKATVSANVNSSNLVFQASAIDNSNVVKNPSWTVYHSVSTSGVPTFDQLNFKAPDYVALGITGIKPTIALLPATNASVGNNVDSPALAWIARYDSGSGVSANTTFRVKIEQGTGVNPTTYIRPLVSGMGGLAFWDDFTYSLPRMVYTNIFTDGSGHTLTISAPTLAGNVATTFPVPSGTTAKFCSTTGTLTSGHLVAFDASGNCVDGGASPGALTASGNTTTYCSTTGTLTSGHLVSIDASGNCVDSGVTASNVATLVGTSADLTAQSADVGTTSLLSSGSNAGGMYEVSCYLVISQAATSSSTLPACQVQWTDTDTSTLVSYASVSSTTAGNTVGNNSTGAGGNTKLIYSKSATGITWKTSGYASSGATAMQFAVHVRIRKISN